MAQRHWPDSEVNVELHWCVSQAAKDSEKTVELLQDYARLVSVLVPGEEDKA